MLSRGTFRADRKNLPREVKVNKLKRGECIWKSDGVVSVTQWRDTRNVHIMSIFHDPTETVQIERKLCNGTKIYITSPKSIKDYNLHIGGVDKFDQKRNAYVSDRRSKKWWLRLFFFLLDAAVVNAFYQYASISEMSVLTFRRACRMRFGTILITNTIQVEVKRVGVVVPQNPLKKEQILNVKLVVSH